MSLFSLRRIIRYKKGRVADRRSGLHELRGRIASLGGAEPRLCASGVLSDILAVDLETLRGAALKSYEDRLDAIVCAYIAYHHWYWRPRRTEIVGDVAEGYIVNPLP